VTKFSIKLKT